MERSKIEKGIEMVLEGLLGPEWESDRNYEDTPRRVADFYEEMFGPRGYEITTFPDKFRQMIVLAHHQAWTLCPHHLLPVRFDVSAAYIPGVKSIYKDEITISEESEVIGLSKLVRLVMNHFTEPILQETLTESVADELMRTTDPQPKGSAVLIYGDHSCTQIRGPKTSGFFVTSAMRGAFLDKPEVRNEFLNLVMRK